MLGAKDTNRFEAAPHPARASAGPYAENPDAPSFLRGGGTMGRLIRTLNWRQTPIGAPETWPQALRTVLRLMLTTNHPMFVFWGSEHICFYNDAYSASLGPEKHPSMLGARGRVAWEEIWPVIGPQIESVLAGGPATWFEDQLIPITRNGRLEELYWTYSYSPIDDESGVGGALVIVMETTARVLAERRQTFFADLANTLSAIADPMAAMAETSRLLGDYLRADCVGYSETDETGNNIIISSDWKRAGFPGVVGRYRLDDFGLPRAQALRSGRTLVIEDILDPTRAAAEGSNAAFAAIQTRALINVPVMRDEKLAGVLFILQATPRAWSGADVALVEEVARRTTVAVERVRAERRLRERESLLAAIGRSSAELIYAKDREHRLIYANPATLAVIGKKAEEVLGRTEAEYHAHPEEARAIMDNDRRAMETGEILRIEETFTSPGGETRVYASTKSPLHDAEGAVAGLVGITTDITERTRDQTHLRLLVDELNHRVKNTLAIVQSIAAQTFRGTTVPPAIGSAFQGRLSALATAHDLLTRTNWEAADLTSIVSGISEGHGGGRSCFNVTGPTLPLPPKTAVTMAMALHELSTNAAKYGSLSVEGGRVDVSWRLDGDRVHLVWRETGGPLVAHPTRRGFGSRMIERALAAELGGQVSLRYEPQGVVCEIEAPAPARMQSSHMPYSTPQPAAPQR